MHCKNAGQKKKEKTEHGEGGGKSGTEKQVTDKRLP